MPSQRTPGNASPVASQAGRAAGLRYVCDEEPGIRRRRCGRGFTYLDASGETVRDPDVRQRISDLPIPPAWRDVWICTCEDGLEIPDDEVD